MKHPFRKRPLSFERMEDRLTLSATTGSHFLSTLIQLNADQGGFVHVDQIHTNVASLGQNHEAYGSAVLIVRGANFYLSSSDSVLDASFDSFDNTAKIAPIPQPHWGNGEIANGMVSLAEIFRPTNPVANVVHPAVREQSAVEMVQTAPPEMNTPALTLARARDVYFEVAGRTEHEAIRGDSFDSLSDEPLMPTKVERPIVSQEADPDPAKAKQLNSSADVRSTAEDYVVNFEPTAVDSAEAADSPRDVSETKEEDASASRQLGASTPEDKLSGVTARDHVLADWRRSESSRDEAASLRSKESEEHLAAWPVVGALIGGGWLIKSRRRQRSHFVEDIDFEHSDLVIRVDAKV